MVLSALVVLPAGSASANVISSNDFDGISKLEDRTLTLLQETNALWGPGTPEATRTCLTDLNDQLDKFYVDLHPLVLLVRLASKMADVTDEKAVIHMLSVEAPYFLKHLEGRRQGIDALLTLPGFGCPQNSTVVADTAHKILRIYSEAATLVGSIVKKIGASPPR